MLHLTQIFKSSNTIDSLPCLCIRVQGFTFGGGGGGGGGLERYPRLCMRDRNLEIAQEIVQEIGMQFLDSENTQCNLKIAWNMYTLHAHCVYDMQLKLVSSPQAPPSAFCVLLLHSHA